MGLLSRTRKLPERRKEVGNRRKRLSNASVVRADFHCSSGSRVNVKSWSPASSRLVATASHLSRHLRMKTLRRFSTA
jgi:hypothetical protein